MKRLSEMTSAEINELWKNQTPIQMQGGNQIEKDGRISYVGTWIGNSVMVHVEWNVSEERRKGTSTLNRPSESYYSNEVKSKYNRLYVA